MGMIKFIDSPSLGTEMAIDEQTYRLDRTEPYEKSDGGKVNLLVWKTDCPSCGEAFEAKTTLNCVGIRRRCAKCASPGKPVKGKRGRRVSVSISALGPIGQVAV